MKRVEILSNAMVPSGKEGQPKIAFRGSVIEVDDEVAGELVASTRGVIVKDNVKLADTTKEHEALAAEASEKAKSPEAHMIGLVAAAMAQALANAGFKPAAGA